MTNDDIAVIVTGLRKTVGVAAKGDIKVALTICGHLLYSFCLELAKRDKKLAALHMTAATSQTLSIAEKRDTGLAKPH